METETGDCKYASRMYNTIVLCMDSQKCPRKLRMGSSDYALFRCTGDGKVEKRVKENISEEVLVEQ